MVTRGRPRVAAPGPPSFELHTLGWRAFQDLCAAVVRTVWGQSAHAFADSNDGGRDGAFYGIWHNPPDGGDPLELPDGPFVVQCKHTKIPGGTLSESDLEEEFAKIPALVAGGLCRSYALMTNARITGHAEAKIRTRLLDSGVERPLVLDGQWICDSIALHQKLRLFVPRVYGLGDLSQILDGRAYEQASVLLGAARDQVAAFVITEPYRKAAQALHDHGFVLLLGDPAVGKSVIAMMLALAAADNWGCLTVKARTASELVTHWNPNEPGQFFWVDDAFGAVRHEEQLTQDWARSMQHINAAIGNGARVVLTSRNYIYQAARPLLKEYAYSRLREQQVIVDVEDLTLDERRHILYNHITGGDQPVNVKTTMKPFLDHAAAAEPFRPEVARRLGLRAFTGRLALTMPGIADFMTHPRQFLRDVYGELGPDQQAALALVYAAAPDGSLASPLSLDEAQLDIITRAGATPAGVARSLDALTGSFLQVTAPPLGQPGWAFRHPTLWEGFASWVATQTHLLTVLLHGLTDAALLRRVDCEDENAEERNGTLLRVPPPLYRPVAERLAMILREPFIGDKWTTRAGRLASTDAYNEHLSRKTSVHSFLSRRSSDSFLRVYLDVDPGLPDMMLGFTSYLSVVSEPDVLGRLHGAGLLREPVRLRAVERVTELAIETPDSGWLTDDIWKFLLTPGERAALMQKVREELVPALPEIWLNVEEGDGAIEESLDTYREEFEKEGDHEIAAAFEQAARQCAERAALPYDDEDAGQVYRQPIASTRLAPPPDRGRSIFDDIGEG